jgi:hypothetical protein
VGLARWSQQGQGSYVGFSIAIFWGWATCRGKRLALGANVAGGLLGAGARRFALQGRLAGEPLGCLWVEGWSESRWVIVVQLWGGKGGTVSGVGAWYIGGWVLHTSRDSRRGWGRRVYTKFGGDGRAQDSQATQS